MIFESTIGRGGARAAVGFVLAALSACHSGGDQPDADRVVRDGGPDTAGGGCASIPGSVLDGWPCACADDCLTGAVCASESAFGYPGGACARLCPVGGAPVCSAGATCEDVGASTGMCSAACTTDADCPSHRHCYTDGICLAYCFGDNDCNSGHCNTYSNQCTPDVPTVSGGGVYAQCVRHADCKSNNCGYKSRCVTSCSLTDGRCPDGAVCVQPTGTRPSTLGFCYPACESGGRCADPTLACSATGIPQNEMACFVPSTDSACLGPRALPDTDGLACGCNADCSEGAACVTEMAAGPPHGLCFRNCTKAEGTPCGSDAVCNSAYGYCERRCTTDADCGAPGRICGPNHICSLHCANDGECAAAPCDPYTGFCQATAAQGAAMGASCSVDSDCKSGDCDDVGHYCWSYCRVSVQDCPDGAVCGPAAPNSSSDLGYCFPRCAGAADCTTFGITCRATARAPAGTPMHCE